MYVSTRGSSQVRAIALEDAGAYRIGDQVHEDDIDTVAVADSHAGIWANDEHLYVVAPAAGSAAPSGVNQWRVVAFNRETGLHDSDVEIVLTAANQRPEDIWSDGETIWVLDGNFDLIFAYDLVTGDRLHSLEVVLDPLNGAGRGLWSDGAVMWVSDLSRSKLFAYSMDEDSLGERQLEHEFETDSDNDRPRGIWSDGTTMWVVDEADRKLFAYTHPGNTEETADPGVELMIPDGWGDVIEGDSVAYSLVLQAEPEADVVIDVTHTENEDFSISPSSLTFTPSNWSAPQDISISITHDSDTLNDGIHITHTVNAASSSDEYDDVVINTLGFTALDIDTAGITVSVLRLVINEPSSTSYTVVLDAAPASNVVIEVWKMGEATVSVAPSLLTFTSTNWFEEQQIVVTAIDDADRADGTATVFHRVTADGTSDSKFVSVLIDPIQVVVNDTDDVVVTVGSLAFNEGSNSSYSVVLDAAPSNDIAIDVTVSGDSDITVSPSTLTFTTSNWSTSQDVTVSALEDTDNTDDEATISHTVSTAGSAHITISSVEVTVTDNDPGATVSAEVLTIDEGGSGSYTIVLDIAPESDVVVGVWPYSRSDLERSPSTLTFTSSNWSTPQTVTITASQDDDDNHDHVKISHIVDQARSPAEYHVFVESLTVAITDDDIDLSFEDCEAELASTDTSEDSSALYGRVPSKDISLNAGCDDDSYRSKFANDIAGDSGRNVIWIADSERDAVLAYSIDPEDSYGEYLVDVSFVLPGHIARATGIWYEVDTASFHIANEDRAGYIRREDILAKLYELDSSHETLSSISYDSDNGIRGAVWGDDSTLWVLDFDDDKIYAYDRSTGSPDSDKDITLVDGENVDARGMWSDGTTMWVTDKANQYVYAYSLVDNQSYNFGQRAKTHEFGLAGANADPRAIWSDGSTMWVLDSSETQLFAYKATGQRSGGL